MRRKRRKSTKRRAHTTHGYGSMKKHRGAGNRGGRGMAGTGKRGDQKKSKINPSKYFGRKGFRSLKKKAATINVSQLKCNLHKLEKKKCLEKRKGNVYFIDLTKASIDKLIGAGKVEGVFIIKVKAASKRAIEKIEKLGGKIELPSKESVPDKEIKTKQED